MNLGDCLRAACVILIWGLNFVVIKIGVAGMPPFLFAALRFTLIALPAVFFIKPPGTKLYLLVFYGMTISFGQFALLFLAIRLGMPAGIASLVIQSQAFFTALLGILLGERLRFYHLLGFSIAGAGMCLVGMGSGGTSDITILTMLLTLLAALCWGLGNLANKLIMLDKRSPVNGLSLVVWSSLVPIVPFYLCSYIFEGKDVIINSIANIHVSAFLALLYLVYISSYIGFTFWSDLLSRHESWRVAPLTLVVPVIGLASSAFFLHETITHQQVIGAIIVFAGLFLNMFGGRFMSALSPVRFFWGQKK
ncbi:EamA family transporter [Serratia sp. AKBS12]|uniref:EamA family transporter n=1 Tax=Serratia sp. AKBS12 TaxID=2974597 RepID=UPI00216511EB|nr:EamA family transporter [Serratia sp. AKBS12]MCS3409881.1 EamA family transporter [Serratia sp. AKBS12]HEI8867311.1 EamA family transporter [Serratia odorifera]